MKQLLIIILILVTADFLLFQCANPKAPTGGPQDSIPPTLVSAIPEVGSLNVTTMEIILVFDEWISVEKLSANLIITPQLDNKYKTITKKNKLILRFEKPFPDSTTITLNFFDGITDITEKNPAVNLSYVFSTGDYLDSLQVSGSVKDLFTNKEQEKVLVGLYPNTDTLDIYKTKPMYFTSTNKSGSFHIFNIKQGDYKLVAFKDDNRNLLFDASAEAYGFLANTITLDSNIRDLTIPIVKINAAPLQKVSSKSNGNYYDIRYNKPIDSLYISDTLTYHLLDDRLTARIYKPVMFTDLADSLQTRVFTQDSLGNTSTDTLFIKFTEQTRKPAKLEAKLYPQSKSIDVTNTYQITFNKPIKSFEPSLFNWNKDSTYSIALDTSLNNYKWNHTKTSLTIRTTFDTTAYLDYQRQIIQTLDSLATDTTEVNDEPQPTRGKQAKQTLKLTRSINLTAMKGAFISIENDTLPTITQEYTFFQQKQTGKILLNITTEQPSYRIQLINKQYQTIREFEQTKKLSITNLPPGDYGVRILLDANQDGKWTYGNIRQNVEPEPIYVSTEFTSLRANWEVSLDISF